MKNKIKPILKASLFTKYISIIVATSLILTSVPGLVGANIIDSKSVNNSSDKTTESVEFSFSTPEIISYGDYVKIKVDNLQMRMRAGEPQLPTLSYRIEFPFGSTDIQVDFDHSPVEKMIVDGAIAPGPVPQLLDDQRGPIIKAISKLLSRLNSKLNYNDNHITEIDDFREDIYNSHESYGEFFDSNVFIGRNVEGELATFVLVRIMPCIFSDPANGELSYFTEATLTVSCMEPSTPLLNREEYDLLILSANDYVSILDDLVDHKEEMGLNTILVSLDEIYDEDYFEIPEWTRDNAEKIKYFIYNAVMDWGVRYVMAVGGWRTFLGFNKPDQQFPIRMSHTYEGEPMIACDQYFSCCIKDDGGPVFDTWDSNENDRFAEWDWKGWDYYDPYPDVSFGRLACRNKQEVETMVDKIITYETETYGEEWFNKILSITGDGFQDLGYRESENSNKITWNIDSLDDGEYTIYAQSELRYDSSVKGKIDVINVTIDGSSASAINFGEDDHLPGKIVPLDDSDDVFPDCYPGYPVAEIVVPQEGDILGNTPVGPYVSPMAYEGERWAVVEYNADEGELYIRTKSYDPSPHALHAATSPDWKAGSQTICQVWIEDSNEAEVFRDSFTQHAYWEGEIEGEQALVYANGGSYEAPSVDEGPFETSRIWTSNGNFTCMWDALDAFSEGYGLAYINGHSSCMVWGDHFPGIPGGRANGQVNGLATINLAAGLNRYQHKKGDPLFPLSKLKNGDKLPILLYSGCHSAQFDTSLMSLLFDPYNVLFGDRYATWTPEGVGWWITRLDKGGSIATIGNTGLGSGYIGDGILNGLTGWIFPRFFFNYNGDLDENGQPSPKLDILGEVHVQTLIDYHEKDDVIDDKTVRKHFEQWALLGDPSLKIGGYDMSALGQDQTRQDNDIIVKHKISGESPLTRLENTGMTNPTRPGEYKITNNPAEDTDPDSIISDGSGKILVGFEYETPYSGDIHPGFTYSAGGAVWNELIWANSYDSGASSLYRWEDDDGEHYVGSVSFGDGPWGCFRMGDMTNPNTWEEDTPWAFNNPLYPGRWGLAVTGHENVVGGIWTYTGGVFADWVGPGIVSDIAGGSGAQFDDFAGDCDHSNGWHFWVFEKTSSNQVYIVRAEQTTPLVDNFQTTIISSALNPDVAAEDGWAYVVSENSGSIECRVSSSNGASWDVYTVTGDGSHPKILITEDGDVECYYVRDSNVYKSTSINKGETWTENGQISDAEVVGSSSPYQVVPEGIVYDKGDGDLYADIFVDTIGAMISDIELDDLEDGRKIVTTITNSGTTDADLDWEISIVGDSPLGDFLAGGVGPILGSLIRAALKGRILLGRRTSGSESLAVTEPADIESKSVFGIGHVMITVTVSSGDDVLVQKTEDGFLLGRHILLRYPEE